MDRDDYKYVMVAAYRCPREYMSAMSIPEVDRELYVPSDEEEDDELFVAEDKEIDSSPSGEESDEKVIDGATVPTLDDEVEELQKPVDLTTIYVTRPLTGRKSSEVLLAARDILLQLRQTGLYVSTIHTDRAREFSSKIFQAWTKENQLKHTRTAGGDPAGNSTAELGIKWAKNRIRSLLKGAKASECEWPMAISHASASLRGKAFPMSTWAKPPATMFGSEVWFRAKV